MALLADLYLDRIEILKYFPGDLCERCGCKSCGEWLEKLKFKQMKVEDCPYLQPNVAYGLQVVLGLRDVLPRLEITQHPVAGILGRQEINSPGPEAPILITGNAFITQEVLLAVLSTTSAPFHLIFVDTGGYTIDMAMIFGTFTSNKILDALEDSGLGALTLHREIILPGLASSLKAPIEASSQWKAKVGPVCVGELPLFMGPYWTRPKSGKCSS